MRESDCFVECMVYIWASALMYTTDPRMFARMHLQLLSLLGGILPWIYTCISTRTQKCILHFNKSLKIFYAFFTDCYRPFGRRRTVRSSINPPSFYSCPTIGKQLISALYHIWLDWRTNCAIYSGIHLFYLERFSMADYEHDTSRYDFDCSVFLGSQALKFCKWKWFISPVANFSPQFWCTYSTNLF